MKRRLVWAPAQAGCPMAVSQQWAAGWQSVSDAEELAVGGSGKARPRFLQPSVQFSRSVVSDSLWPHGLQHARLPCPISNSRTYSNSCPWRVMSSNHLNFCHPLLLPPLIFPSIRVFSNESVLHIRWPMYWSFSFSISPSNEYSWLISFRMDWFDLLAVQGTLKRVFSNTTVQKHQFFNPRSWEIW